MSSSQRRQPRVSEIGPDYLLRRDHFLQALRNGDLIFLDRFRSDDSWRVGHIATKVPQIVIAGSSCHLLKEDLQEIIKIRQYLLDLLGQKGAQYTDSDLRGLRRKISKILRRKGLTKLVDRISFNRVRTSNLFRLFKNHSNILLADLHIAQLLAIPADDVHNLRKFLRRTPPEQKVARGINSVIIGQVGEAAFAIYSSDIVPDLLRAVTGRSHDYSLKYVDTAGIDFVVSFGNRSIPVEIKTSEHTVSTGRVDVFVKPAGTGRFRWYNSNAEFVSFIAPHGVHRLPIHDLLDLHFNQIPFSVHICSADELRKWVYDNPLLVQQNVLYRSNHEKGFLSIPTLRMIESAHVKSFDFFPQTAVISSKTSKERVSA